MSGATLTPWAVEALIASALLMVFVLLVRKAAQRAFGPQLAYWLWALPVLRLVTPPLPAAWRESVAAPISVASETVLVFITPVIDNAAVEPATIPWVALITGGWLLGALAFFTWHGLAHFAYVRRIVSPPARHERLADGTTLVESDEAIGPAAFGVWRRFVAVPRDFADRYDADERRLALAHELGHHARGDLIANWIALAVLAVHWFNPLAWIAYRKFRTDQELANDARVLAALPPVERHAYACAILKAANGGAITAACHLHTIEDLKGRLKMLKASRKSRRVVLAGATGIIALTIAGLGLTASGIAAEQIRTTTADRVVAMATPAAPPPPAVPATEPSPAPAAPAERFKQVVIVKNGKTRTIQGAEADAYIAANPSVVRYVDPNKVGRHRIVIRGKDGVTQTYEGAEAEAYLKAHPDMRPPLPPVPPVGAIGAVPPPPAAPLSPTALRFVADRLQTTSRNCHGDFGDSFVRSEMKDGTAVMVICRNHIQRFAAQQARLGMMSARMGIATARSAILAERNLSDAQRHQALAGLDQALAEIDQQPAEQARARHD